MTGKPYHLPSEAEWEKAARGTDGHIYSWGNGEPTTDLLNFNNQVGDTTEVGRYPEGASSYGVLDMAGNVWEWTRSLWGEDWSEPEFKYPYDPEDGRGNLDASDDVRRVLRGGAFFNYRRDVRCAVRFRSSPVVRFRSYGFRVVVSPFTSEL